MENVFVQAACDTSISRATGLYGLVKGLGDGPSQGYEWYLRV